MPLPPADIEKKKRKGIRELVILNNWNAPIMSNGCSNHTR